MAKDITVGPQQVTMQPDQNRGQTIPVVNHPQGGGGSANSTASGPSGK